MPGVAVCASIGTSYATRIRYGQSILRRTVSLTHCNAHYGFTLTSCGLGRKSSLAMLRCRTSKPRQESTPHKVRVNHIMQRDAGFVARTYVCHATARTDCWELRRMFEPVMLDRGQHPLRVVLLQCTERCGHASHCRESWFRAPPTHAPPLGHTMPCTHSHQYVQTIADLLRLEPTETLARGWAEAPRAVGWRKPARHAPAKRRNLILRGRRRRFHLQKAGWIPLKRAD
jgi:hypothetical protein